LLGKDWYLKRRVRTDQVKISTYFGMNDLGNTISKFFGTIGSLHKRP
jgi:hypothetical protein